MIQIDDKLISRYFSEEFVCNLSKCKGICCVEGDAELRLTKMRLKFWKEFIQKLKVILDQKECCHRRARNSCY
jgi:hypothetical protein